MKKRSRFRFLNLFFPRKSIPYWSQVSRLLWQMRDPFKQIFLTAIVHSLIFWNVFFFYQTTWVLDMLTTLVVLHFELPIDFITDTFYDSCNSYCRYVHHRFVALETILLPLDTDMYKRIKITEDEFLYIIQVVNYWSSFPMYQLYFLSFLFFFFLITFVNYFCFYFFMYFFLLALSISLLINKIVNVADLITKSRLEPYDYFKLVFLTDTLPRIKRLKRTKTGKLVYKLLDQMHRKFKYSMVGKYYYKLKNKLLNSIAWKYYKKLENYIKNYLKKLISKLILKIKNSMAWQYYMKLKNEKGTARAAGKVILFRLYFTEWLIAAFLFHIFLLCILYFYNSTTCDSLLDVITYVFVFLFELPFDFIMEGFRNNSSNLTYDTFIAYETNFRTQDTSMFTRIKLTEETCRDVLELINYVSSFNNFQLVFLSFFIFVPIYIIIFFFFLLFSVLLMCLLVLLSSTVNMAWKSYKKLKNKNKP